MSLPILATKLYTPSMRVDCVSRPRLLECLDRGAQSKFTLVSASAGFGKSTLISDWARACDRPVAWLSLDAGDSDLQRFLMYLVAALRAAQPGCLPGTAMALESAQPINPESVLTILLNELSLLDHPIVLVLDDYHLIDAKPVDEALAFLLEHLPPVLHLVIATREDPQLPLARFRAKGLMTELRAADLRFTAGEATRFLNEAMGLELGESDITALELRTEGWIAGLQMAALSMQGRDDNSDFIAAFTGSHRFVLDYLAEEVLQRQPENVREFLSQTAVLKRLNGGLCDAVTGRQDSANLLNALERENLFLVPLDDHRRWYRYHHLFGDVLRAHASLDDKNSAALHTRASAWFEKNGFFTDAIEHALAAKDSARATRLVEQVWPELRKTHPESLFLNWLAKIPEQHVNNSPILNTYRGFALLSVDIEAADASLRHAEEWRDSTKELRAENEQRVVEPSSDKANEYRVLPGMIAVARAYYAGAKGDLAGIVKNAEQAIAVLPSDAPVWRGSAAALLGIAQWMSGDLDAAYESIAAGSDAMRRAGDLGAVISTKYLMAELKGAKGLLREARRECQKALEFAEAQDGPPPQGTGDIYVTLAAIHLRCGELEQAERDLLTSRALGEHALLPESRHHWYIVMAKIKQAQGDLGSAEELLEEARDVQIDSPAPDVRPVAAWLARLALEQGRISQALGWVQARGLAVDDAVSYFKEFEHLTLARVLIAQWKDGTANADIEPLFALLERLRASAENGQRIGGVIEALVLKAELLEIARKPSEALRSLESALLLAEPEGIVEPFTAEGDVLKPLLQVLAKNSAVAEFAQKALGISGTSPKKQLPPQGALIEPLSDRELEVLRFLASELTGPEIASRIFVSLNTLRTHTKNIYSKLGVNNRRAAVRRAGEFGLT